MPGLLRPNFIYLNRQTGRYLLVDVAHLFAGLENRQSHQDAGLGRAQTAQIIKLLDDGHIDGGRNPRLLLAQIISGRHDTEEYEFRERDCDRDSLVPKRA